MQVVTNFTSQLEKFARSLQPELSKSYKFKSLLEMKTQITEFVRTFHGKQIENINVALDREKWKMANEEKIKKIWPTVRIKEIIERKRTEEKSKANGTNGSATNNNNSDTSNGDGVHEVNGCDGDQTVLTAEVFYLILEAVADYCQLFMMTSAAEVVLGVVEVLRVANTRINHLILGAGAVELKVCKSITVTILVIVLRGLKLIADSIAEVEDIFQKRLNSSKSQPVVRISIFINRVKFLNLCVFVAQANWYSPSGILQACRICREQNGVNYRRHNFS